MHTSPITRTRSEWVYRFWLNLTEKGKQAATATEQGQRVARKVEEDTGKS